MCNGEPADNLVINPRLRALGPLRFATACLALASCGTKASSDPPREEGDRPGECEDGIDNDNDGFLDCLDAGCEDRELCTPEDSPDYCGPYGGYGYYYGDYGDYGGYTGEPPVHFSGMDILTTGNAAVPGEYDCELYFMMDGVQVDNHRCAQCDYVFDVSIRFVPGVGTYGRDCREWQADRRQLIGLNSRFELRLAYDGTWTEYRYRSIDFDPLEYDILAYMEWESGVKDVPQPGPPETRYLTHHYLTIGFLEQWR